MQYNNNFGSGININPLYANPNGSINQMPSMIMNGNSYTNPTNNNNNLKSNFLPSVNNFNPSFDMSNALNNYNKLSQLHIDQSSQYQFKQKENTAKSSFLGNTNINSQSNSSQSQPNTFSTNNIKVRYYYY